MQRAFALAVALGAAGCHGEPAAPTRIPATISASPSPDTMPQFGTQQLTVTILDAHGDTLAGLAPTFTSDDSAILAVSRTGLISSRGPAGAASVRVALDSLTTQVAVTVAPVPASIAGLPAHITLGAGGFFPLRGHVRDLLGTEIANATPQYRGDPIATLTVVSGPFVQSLGSLGSAVVVATYSNAFGTVVDTIPITVNQFAAPSGTIIDTFATSSPAIGVAASSSVVYVTLLTASGPLERLPLPARGFGAPVQGVVGGEDIAFVPSGTTAYVATLAQDTVAVVDAAGNQVTGYISAHVVGNPRDVVAMPDSHRVYVATDNVWIYALDDATKAVVDSVHVSGIPTRMCPHPTAPFLYVSLDNDSIAEINTDSDKVTRMFYAGIGTQGTAVAPDGSELYNVTENNHLFVFNLTTGNKVADVPGLGGWGIAATPDGSRLYIVGGAIKIVDRLARSLIDSVPVGGWRIALSHDGGTAFITDEGGGLRVVY
jgi:YVTN family beta-propeller protein